MKCILSIILALSVSYFSGGNSLLFSCAVTSVAFISLHLMMGRGKNGFLSTFSAIVILSSIGDTLSYLIAEAELLPTLLNCTWILFVPSLFFILFGRGYSSFWNRGATLAFVLLFMLITVIGFYSNSSVVSSYYLLHIITCGWITVLFKTFVNLWYKDTHYSY